MATYSSILAWKIPWTEEPGRLWSIASQRVRHDLSDFTFTFILSMGLQNVGHDRVTFTSHNITTYTYVTLTLLGFPVFMGGSEDVTL